MSNDNQRKVCVRTLRPHLIRAAVVSVLGTIWALGYQAQSEAELARARGGGVPAATLVARAAAAVAEEEALAAQPVCPTAGRGSELAVSQGSAR